VNVERLILGIGRHLGSNMPQCRPKFKLMIRDFIYEITDLASSYCRRPSDTAPIFSAFGNASTASCAFAYSVMAFVNASSRRIFSTHASPISAIEVILPVFGCRSRRKCPARKTASWSKPWSPARLFHIRKRLFQCARLAGNRGLCLK
jgi:hypothetical protein